MWLHNNLRPRAHGSTQNHLLLLTFLQRQFGCRTKWCKHPLQTYLFGCRNFPLIIVYKKQTVILWSHWLSTDDGEKKHKFYKYDARIHSALLKVIWVLLNSSSIHRNSKPKKTTEMGSLQLRFCLVSNFEAVWHVLAHWVHIAHYIINHPSPQRTLGCRLISCLPSSTL